MVSGNMATVTMKYSQPTGRPYGFVADPGISASLIFEGGDFTVRLSMCTTCPTI